MRNQNKFNQIALTWLRSAEDDSRWARASFEDGFYRSVCFVSQQTAEKALKAYRHHIQESRMPLLTDIFNGVR